MSILFKIQMQLAFIKLNKYMQCIYKSNDSEECINDEVNDLDFRPHWLSKL